MAKLRILFIDDNENSVRVAMKWAAETHACDFVPFVSFETELANRQPHIAVVDRIQGTPPAGTDEGVKVFDSIWTKRFCPIVMYSAFPEPEADDRMRHPMVRHVKKAADLREFQEAINGLVPHAQGLEDAEQHIRQQFALAMREVAPYAAEAFPEPAQYRDAVTRHGRRRLAALADEMALGKLASWEQYIHPPVSSDPMLGDILRSKDGDKNKAESFCVVLTPSCDLSAPEGRKAKVDQVLVAACCSPKQAIQQTALGRLSKEKIADTLTSTVLTQGYYQKVVPFPLLKGKIPSMMADLKHLKQIPLTEIVPVATARYERVASLDSPFRELIAWAYMQTACRPGLPDRDCDAWKKEIMDSYDP